MRLTNLDLESLSTCDALIKFKDITSSIVDRGGYAIAVSLDFKNAFNSIPWWIVRRALEIKNFPLYIRRIIDVYQSDRSVFYVGGDGTRCRGLWRLVSPRALFWGPSCGTLPSIASWIWRMRRITVLICATQMTL